MLEEMLYDVGYAAGKALDRKNLNLLLASAAYAGTTVANMLIYSKGESERIIEMANPMPKFFMDHLGCEGGIATVSALSLGALVGLGIALKHQTKKLFAVPATIYAGAAIHTLEAGIAAYMLAHYPSQPL